MRLHVVAGCKELGRRHPTWHLVLVPGHDEDDEENDDDYDEKKDNEEYDDEEEED